MKEIKIKLIEKGFSEEEALEIIRNILIETFDWYQKEIYTEYVYNPKFIAEYCLEQNIN